MEKNYNYNYENREQGPRNPVRFESVSLGSCTASALKSRPVSNGQAWHTTDTNEFYFDWNGKRTKLNVSGDNANLTAEINKLKAKVNALDVDTVQNKINQLETKVNNAASQANSAKTAAQTAQQQAAQAAQDAQDAAAQVADKADKSYVDDAIAGINIPDVSGFALKSEIPDVSDFASKSDIPDVSGLASKSEIPDVSGFASKSEIPDVSGLASKSEIPDVSEFLKESDLGDYAQKSDIPDVSGLASKSEIPDVSGFAAKTDIPEVPENVSAFINDAGYITENDLPDFLKESDLDEFAVGEFPAAADADDETAPLDGYAKVQDIMDYVNALIEKKKDELAPVGGGVPYAYITGYALDGTATNITVFNQFELNEEGDTVIEFRTSQEIGAWDPSTNDDLPSIKLTVDIPVGYSITEAQLWDNLREQYSTLSGANQFGTNPRYSSRVIDGVTYNSYVRGPIDEVETRGAQRYKITITK